MHKLETNILKEIWLASKKIRKELNYSQERLAYKSRIERQIGRIERGEINTGVSSMFLIAITLKIDLKDLFDFNY